MTATSAVPRISPWPADAGYFRSGAMPINSGAHVDYGACTHCGRSVYVIAGRLERHTDTGEIICHDRAGFAMMLDTEQAEVDVELALENQARELEDEAEKSAQHARNDGFDKGHDEGRKEMYAELTAALKAATDKTVARVIPDQADAFGPLIDALAEVYAIVAP
jgi:hypothetical protein